MNSAVPLRSVGNLPAEPSSFVGRRDEVVAVRRLLSVARLVTLTGVGGVGKSRLAVRVAAGRRRSYPDGVWLVAVAELHDASLVPQAVSNALGIADRSTRDQGDVLADFLADRRLLLVLDNCEHLVQACAELAIGLLRAAPGLRVLATSREVLQLIGEYVYAVPPLPVPEAEAPLGAGAGVRYPGLELFRQRAVDVRSGFAVSDNNVDLVARICRRLDGIPLAIELAAARLDRFSLTEIASRLDDRFALLTGGGTRAPTRYEALHSAVAWSFELCTTSERLLWARSSVFAGRFDLDAAERVCAGDDLPAGAIFDAVAGLVSKSLLIAEEQAGDMRYRMLDTVREFGLARLRADWAVGSEASVRSRHRDWCAELAERFHADWFGPQQVHWAQRMATELPNIRVALGYCLGASAEARAGLRLAGALYFFWFACGEIREGRRWLEQFLAAESQPSRERMRALAAYARLLLAQGDYAAIAVPARQCLELAHRFDEPFFRSDALQILGLSRVYCDDPAAGRPLLEEAVAVAGELGAVHLALALATLALAMAHLLGGDVSRADELCAESRRICRACADEWWFGAAVTVSSMLALSVGDAEEAARYGRDALRSRRALNDAVNLGSGLEMLAWAAAAGRDYRRAARLLGAADRQGRALGGSPYASGVLRGPHQRCEDSTRQALGDVVFNGEFAAGRDLSLDDAVTYALAEPTVEIR